MRENQFLPGFDCHSKTSHPKFVRKVLRNSLDKTSAEVPSVPRKSLERSLVKVTENFLRKPLQSSPRNLLQKSREKASAKVLELFDGLYNISQITIQEISDIFRNSRQFKFLKFCAASKGERPVHSQRVDANILNVENIKRIQSSHKYIKVVRESTV